MNINLNKSADLNSKMECINSASDGKSRFEVLSINPLEGALNTNMAMKLFFAQQSGLRLKQVRILLNNSAIKTEAGALYYYCGDISSETKIGGVAGLFKKSVAGGLTSESSMKPTYSGKGEIVLEPSFKHYIIMTLDNDSIIVDKGMFFCCSDSIEIKPVIQKNISSALLGGEGVFQIKLEGTGIVILESSVPENEIVKYDIKNGEVLKVDGNFAIARTSGITFSVTKSDKSLIGSALNGEGFLQTFTGEGSIWLAPTSTVYEKMLGFDLPMNNNNMNNRQLR